MKNAKKHHSILIPLLSFILINLLALDGLVIYNQFTKKNVLGTTDNTDTCPTACINLIQKNSATTTREYYVPIGSGSNTTTNWSDVTGAQAYVDTSTYGKIKKVTFEATLAVPGASQISYVRLFNSTDKHPVWYSEMSMTNSGPQLLISVPITLDSGNKLYQVQMKSQLGSITNLNQARLHILTY